VKPHKGLFRPINPAKYKGNPNNIIFRSSWELVCMRRFDLDPSIIFWASEEIGVPYLDRSSIDADTGKRKSRMYYPDFIVKKKNKDGAITTIMIEIKPYVQSVPPVKGKKTDQRFLTEVSTFAKNISKWEYAREFCRRKGWQFIVLTEKELFSG